MVRKLCHGLCNICKHYLPTEQGLKVSFAGMFPPRETVLAVHVGKRKEKRTTDWWCITHSVLDNEWGQSRIPDKADCCCVFSHTCKVPTNYDLSRWRGVTVNTFLMLLTHTHTHTHTHTEGHSAMPPWKTPLWLTLSFAGSSGYIATLLTAPLPGQDPAHCPRTMGKWRGSVSRHSYP